MRTVGQSGLCGDKLVCVVLDTGSGDDRHVLQDIQGGGEAEGSAESCLEQHRAEQHTSASDCETSVEGVESIAVAPKRRLWKTVLHVGL